MWNSRWQREWKAFQEQHADEPEFLRFLKDAYDRTSMLLMPGEAYFLHQIAGKVRDVPGDIAEVGMFRGGSAVILCDAKGGKNFYGFDTFEGLPETFADESRILGKGQYEADISEVRTLLSPYPGVHLLKGFFPDTAGPIENQKFALVHLDVDLYVSMKASLEFFWPRLSVGGAIVVHDIHFEGVRRAVDEFAARHPEVQGRAGAGTQWVVSNGIGAPGRN